MWRHLASLPVAMNGAPENGRLRDFKRAIGRSGNIFNPSRSYCLSCQSAFLIYPNVERRRENVYGALRNRCRNGDATASLYVHSVSGNDKDQVDLALATLPEGSNVCQQTYNGFRGPLSSIFGSYEVACAVSIYLEPNERRYTANSGDTHTHTHVQAQKHTHREREFCMALPYSLHCVQTYGNC